MDPGLRLDTPRGAVDRLSAAPQPESQFSRPWSKCRSTGRQGCGLAAAIMASGTPPTGVIPTIPCGRTSFAAVSP